ncbi:hypothetical protein AEAC466_12420 [Asticcacaulis sp. AC466]|uniref:DUF6311 domain-containing protein n=1 Tax=Asticcacaulis sp. AC466 TaxID=1282362 RepID=UPI0003C3EFB3|nr:DUF6311 domain-containing protein [Asticcacaulis sp. AC466]ESQ83473.1 hypothetical protein AEAC466_12420 [Asticcacaulis sp. AC466]
MTLPTWLRPGPLFAKTQAAVRRMPPEAWTGLHRGLCLIAPLLLFAAFFDLNVLNPTRILWLLDEDWGQHVLGWNAFRHMPWSTFNHETLLGAPVGNTIISTDSNPLFAFFFKTFRHWLPDNFQYIGPWFLFCVIMHFTFAYKLIRPHAPNRWAALGGAIALSALPMLYYRMRHDTLVAQWLILWGLHLFINVRDDQLPAGKGLGFVLSWFRNGAKMRGYSALLFVTGLIHPYILFMVAAIWGGDCLKRFFSGLSIVDRKLQARPWVLVDAVVRAVFTLAWAILALFIAGSFTKGMSPGAGGFGYYSFPLDAWFNPVKPEFSSILKAWPLDGGQSFEGYQYLGFGLIVLVVASAILYFTQPEARQSRSFIAALRPLTAPFIVLLLIAVSNHAQFYGYDVWKFKLPDELRGPAAVLRASGRLTWPITYLLIVTALVVLFKSRPKTIAILLPLVLVVQAYDIAGMSRAMRKATALAASTEKYHETPSPEWDQLVSAAKGIDFYPTNVHLNDRLFYELTWRATSQVKPVNTMYAARENLIQIANQEASQDAFKRGEIRTDHLFVFLKQCDAPPSLWPKLRMLDGVWIIPPEGVNLDLPAPEWTPLRPEVRFGWLDQGTCLLDENWSRPEYDGVWSEGPQANLRIPIKHVQFDTPRPKALDLTLKAKSRKPVLVSVVINNVKMDEIMLDHTASLNTIHLPASVMRGETLKIRFLIDEPGRKAKTTVVSANVSKNVRGRSEAHNLKPVPLEAKDLGIKLIDIKLTDPDTEPKPPVPGQMQG